MPEDMSPEEKLLRLIKGDKEPAKPQSQPVSDNNGAQKPEDKKNGKKPTSPAPSQKTPEPQKMPEPQEKKPSTVQEKDKTVDKTVKKASQSSPIDKEIRKKLTEDKNLETFKKAMKKQEEVKEDKKTDVSKPEQTQQKEKSAPVTSVPPVQTTESKKKTQETKDTTNATPQPEEKPDKKSEKEQEPSKVKENFIVHAYRFIVSGFSVICWLLLIILLLSIGATAWHVHNVSLREYIIPDISVSRQEETQTENETNVNLPKPFPYFAEEMATKKLFKLVKPPPPPKPPEPEKKEPEAPKIKIETLTRHFVLQGIVYDIGPPQAIIFNKKENKTMFLGNEEMLNESVKIKKILRGKVILEYEDQTQEMTF